MRHNYKTKCIIYETQLLNKMYYLRDTIIKQMYYL
jgi:hypothetical protein